MPPLVIAHRGASAYEPENTLRAFDLAIRQGAQMIELDLHVTCDNHVVVIHDPTLNHTTNLTGRVDRLTLAEVRRADAGKGGRTPSSAPSNVIAGTVTGGWAASDCSIAA